MFYQDLKQKDDVYVKDLKKSAEDIELMIERMNDLYKQLLKAFDEEIIQVEVSDLDCGDCVSVF